MSELERRRQGLDDGLEKALALVGDEVTSAESEGVLRPFESELVRTTMQDAELRGELNLARARFGRGSRQLQETLVQIDAAGLQGMKETAMALFVRRDSIESDTKALVTRISSLEAQIQELELHRNKVSFRRDEARRRVVEIETARQAARLAAMNLKGDQELQASRRRIDNFEAQTDEVAAKVRGAVEAATNDPENLADSASFDVRRGSYEDEYEQLRNRLRGGE